MPNIIVNIPLHLDISIKFTDDIIDSQRLCNDFECCFFSIAGTPNGQRRIKRIRSTIKV